MEPDQDFPKFLKRVRKEENVYLEQLAEGLMAVSQLARIEKGQRPIPKTCGTVCWADWGSPVTCMKIC